MSVRHKSVFCRNVRTDRADFWHGGFLRSILQTIQYVRCEKISGVNKNKRTSFRIFVLNSEGLSIPLQRLTSLRRRALRRTGRVVSSTTKGAETNGPITIAIRVRFEYDSSTIRLKHATTRYKVFLCARIRDRFEHSTRISGRRVLHVD